jgi:hypothetical protein
MKNSFMSNAGKWSVARATDAPFRLRNSILGRPVVRRESIDSFVFLLHVREARSCRKKKRLVRVNRTLQLSFPGAVTSSIHVFPLHQSGVSECSSSIYLFNFIFFTFFSFWYLFFHYC